MKHLFVVLVATLLFPAFGMGQIPQLMSHQGYIADSTGTGITGTVPMTFRMFNDSTGGSAIHAQSFPGVVLTRGVFNVNLDVSSLPFSSQYWLETEVNSQTLAPRTRLTSAPYSMRSDTAKYAHATAGHYIGESYGGGIVFYVDASGQHGLIAATADQSTGIQWYNGSYTTTNATRDGVGAGMYNTQLIISNQGAGNYAAKICADYQGGDYGDWYLPSKYELNLLYLQQTVVGGFANDIYWSSTEGGSIYARSQAFGSGNQYLYFKLSTYYVRAIRAF